MQLDSHPTQLTLLIVPSYLAVTGLPVPQSDHAIIMCKFAHECRSKTRYLLEHDLYKMYGEETKSLAMRFGLHSGPVTAGVLRGEKCRFQLFGDTVNTAARMESTGQRDRIQLSQDTADILVTGGKGCWLHERADMVEAKGKGTLQTYWLRIRSGKGLSTPSKRTVSSDDSTQISELSPKMIEQQNLADQKSKHARLSIYAFGNASGDILDDMDEDSFGAEEEEEKEEMETPCIAKFPGAKEETDP